MINVQKQIAYWRDSVVKDLEFAGRLINREKEIQYGLFFLHQALEKVFKVQVCKQTAGLAPRIHNLLALAKLALITPTSALEKLLAEINTFNIRGRYPDMDIAAPSLR